MSKCKYQDGTEECGAEALPLSRFCSSHQPFSGREATITKSDDAGKRSIRETTVPGEPTDGFGGVTITRK